MILFYKNMCKVLFISLLLGLCKPVMAQPDYAWLDEQTLSDIRLISRTFDELPTDSMTFQLEQQYFPVRSVATCLLLLSAEIISLPESGLVEQRLRAIAQKYVQADTLLLLTSGYNCGPVTQVFNNFSRKHGVRLRQSWKELLY